MNGENKESVFILPNWVGVFFVPINLKHGTKRMTEKIRRGTKKMKVLIQFVLLCLDFHFSCLFFFFFAGYISGSADIIDPFCRSGHFFCVHFIKTPEERRRKNEQMNRHIERISF
jgi:hypothetical protein